ncbi:MAG: hypothetical protein IJ551_09675 [Prevotella sp.]|nr:hypothetical protein [Prevotella sp.]
MKKLFTYRMTTYNGIHPVSSESPLFATRELAEQARQAVIEGNRDYSFKGLRLAYSEVEETCLYESKDEVPILNQKEG